MQRGRQGFQGVGPLLAAVVAGLLVVALRGVDRRLQGRDQHVDEVVLEPPILMGDERDQVEVTVLLGPAGDLEDVRADDAVGVIPDRVVG